MREFLLERAPWLGSPDELTDDYPLIDSGFVDSLTLYELSQRIQDQYGLVVADDEFTHEHFKTIRAIAEFVESKQAN
jgi:acyl carrier protein